MIVFVVNVYNDQHLATRLLNQIKTHTPSPVIVIGDGVILDSSLKEGTMWFEKERLKKEGWKGLWTQRYLELFLENTDASHLIRVDPDTCVWRPFVLPEGEFDLFGEIADKRYRHPYVRGGAIGFTRIAAEKIVKSKMLYDDCYKNFNYERYKWHRWPHEQLSDEKLALQDWIVGDVGYRLGLKLKRWTEVKIFGNNHRIPDPQQFAITHPHPTLT